MIRAYDPLGRITLETTNSGQRGLVTDEAGQLIRMDWDGGPKIAYDRLLTGEVVTMRENSAFGNFTLATFGYDDLGRRTSITRGNGAVTSYGYDPASRLNQLVHNLNGTASDVTFGYSHNPAGEIVSTTRSNDAYAYTGHANANVPDTVNRLNQVAQTGSVAVAHDSRGNTIAIGATTRFDTLLGHIITERDSNGTRLRRFVPGPGVDEPMVWYEGADTSTRRYFHADERGSVIAVSDASGNLVGGINRYDEYGVPQETLTGRFGYTGQPWMFEAGLYHYRARAYNPAMGRFMQTDPIGYSGGMNLYAYVGNNPVNRRDPMGLDCDPDPGASAYICGDRGDRDNDCDEGRFWDAERRHRALCGWGWNPTQYYDAGGVGSGGGGGGADGGTRNSRIFRPSGCVLNFGGAALSQAGVRRYDLRNIEFRRGLDDETSELTQLAYYTPNIWAVTQWDVVYVQPGHWRIFINPSNSEFWEEVRHVVQFQHT